MSNYSFGGAFDVEDDALFTRDDLDEFADEIADDLNMEYGDNDVVVAVIESYAENTVDVGVVLDISLHDDEFEYTSEHRVDLRKVRNPLADLLKYYKQMFLDDFRDEIEKYLY